MKTIDWRARFNQMHFLNKVRLIYSLILIIPILLLECLICITSSNFIKEQQMLEVRSMIERNYQDIQNQMKQCEKSLLYLSSNTMLKEFLVTGDDEYMKRLTLSKNVAPLVYNSLLSTQDFSKILIYSGKNFSISYDLFKNDSEAQDKEWYRETENTSKTLWWYEEEKEQFFITRCVRDSVTEKKLGIIRIDLKGEILAKSFEIFSGVPVEIRLLGKENEFYRYTNIGGEGGHKTGYEASMDMGQSDWQIQYAVDQSYFSTIFHPRILISLMIVMLLLACVWILVNRSTKYLLKHLYRIIDGVKKVNDSNFEIEIDESSGDEIGELAKSINRMLKKIRMLIEEVYKSELDKKNLELNLLQSKINPHFLYNNLSAINWIAIEKGEDRIYEITTQMATFYRTALNRGVNIDRLRVEIDNIMSYIKLQLYAHEDSFQAEYEIEEALLDTRIPIFIMQPLVENAIEHGIDTLREDKGKIRIHIFSEDVWLVIHIWDNGKELFGQIGDSELNSEEFGYGVSNVDKRIKLLCGESSGVKIRADKTGTTSEIRLKKDTIVLDAKS
ncbi:histidine kinase [Muricomes sp. OA1]|uniref:HAMP domain-containing protein n=1 Tax=Hungatella hathewayi TaxID=154046 RepID=A0A3E2WL81_9FIRM|nr:MULTISPECIES: histidine kinase [Clostridia]MCH1971932.1 histidine kinase [Muricomes sp. OA1]MRM89472.1 HAMP domain-containing protein [Faecalicatena contorta]RGC27807.1 HAMP domain-containing protein [Hungatella hathewayi]GKH30732.1 sensor histidine kinase [Faecalicatena contorta]